MPSNKLSPRIFKMISEVYSLSYIVVENENDALILENSLIKQLKPKYNILLRDDKTYPYIYCDFNDDFPRLLITRKVLKGSKIKYFGPYSFGAKDMLDSIYDIVPLIQKKGSIKNQKACLFYQMGKCKAPCENKITKKEYAKLLNTAINLIQNKTTLILQLKQKMLKLSEQMRFEDAMKIRDKIKTIEKSQIQSTLDFAKNENLDLFVVKKTITKAVIIKMFIRNGKLISTKHNFVNITEDLQELDEIYKSAIVDFYSLDLPFVPSTILVDINLKERKILQDFISNKFKKKINIVIPLKGIKKQLINIAKKNCVELLKMNKINTNIIHQELKELFNLYKIPNRYEAFDNSHFMAQATVGAMIVWDNENFVKDDYRLYNLETRDEYSQMKELLTRRVLRFKENPPPDLWIIDGGLTLLKLAYDICQSVGVSLDIIAISKEKNNTKVCRAKGKAKDILYTLTRKIELSTDDRRLHFIQKLRDEAHRSAITFHKKQKRKEDKQISLLEKKGIGKAKITKLINYFGTFEAIKNATFDELKTILNQKDALEILK